MRATMAALAVLALTMGACSSDKTSATKQSDLGTGLNTVERTYAKSAPDTWDASMAAVKAYDLRVDSDRHDSMGGEIQAHRGDGEKVMVKVRSLDDKNSEVSVRVGPGNKNMAEMIHEKIAGKLGMKEARSTLFGGNTAEGTYAQTLDHCVKAAEDTAKKMDMTVTNREVKDGHAVVDARETNSNPVQFKLKKVDEGVKVTFIAGREKTDASKDLAHRMKTEFDAVCAAKAD